MSTLHLNWPADDPKPPRPFTPRNGMTAMAEAFARAGFRPAPQQPQPAPPPDRAVMRQHRTDVVKAEIAEAQSAFKAMSDDELLVEKLSLQANIDIIKVDLTEATTDGMDRSPGWQYRAERALAFIKARLAACIMEVEARRKRQRQQAHHELLGEHAQQRKGQELDRTDDAAFKKAAKTMLPRHTWLAIWSAVEAGKAAASTESPVSAEHRDHATKPATPTLNLPD
jgi:hypothetical protein